MKKKVLKENLIVALSLAISVQREFEKQMRFTRDSGLVSGWVECVDILKKGEELEII